MSYRVRILVAIGGILVFVFIISSIRRSKMMIGDSVFWFLFSLALLIIGIFPEMFFALARTLHVASASNLAYLFLIGLLLIRIFQQDLKISQLTTKLQRLVQNMAIYQADHSEDRKETPSDRK
ncbi:MAG: DUF2304 domain-containing protein [Solobacterium sp.]|nr:DUF2304 domain-containing protein [Solobacterium sp.]